MGLTDIQITISVGWGVRGFFLLIVLFCLILRAQNARARVLLLSMFLLLTSMVGPIAEYFDLGLRFARLAEIAVASIFVGGLYGAVLKIDAPAWVYGTLLLLGSNVLYTLAAVTTDSALEAGLLVIGGVAAVFALFQLNSARPPSPFFQWGMTVSAGIFYLIVAAQAIFGPWVRDDWDRLTWAIIWEVAITVFYGMLAVGTWFYYTAGTVDATYASDWFDMIAFVFAKNQWAPEEPKLSD